MGIFFFYKYKMLDSWYTDHTQRCVEPTCRLQVHITPIGIEKVPAGLNITLTGVQNIHAGIHITPTGVQNIPSGLYFTSTGVQNIPTGIHITPMGIANIQIRNNLHLRLKIASK